jgi:hypothetical protein
MCKYVFSELTPHVRAAVRSKIVRADIVHLDMRAA